MSQLRKSFPPFGLLALGNFFGGVNKMFSSEGVKSNLPKVIQYKEMPIYASFKRKGKMEGVNKSQDNHKREIPP